MIKKNIIWLSIFFLTISHSCILNIFPKTPLQDNNITNQRIVIPTSVNELQQIVKSAAQTNTKISIAGARASQGGQTTFPQALLIDMKNLNKVLSIDLPNKKVTVQAGITWAQLQDVLNSFDLAVTAMQSYATFSVGGALSVNAHGQDLHYAPMIKSVDSLKILLANGELVTASREQNQELFKLAIGGYGLFGVIVEVTLVVTDNSILQRKSQIFKVKNYQNVFEKIKNDPNAQLYATRLSLNPLAFFKRGLAITYYATEKITSAPLQDINRSSVDMKIFQTINDHKILKTLRLSLERFVVERSTSISRNNAMHYSAAKVMRSDEKACDILQEYFIPRDKVNLFLEHLKNTIKKHKINLLNVTLRWVPADRESFLAYAPSDSCAFVLYCSIDNSQVGYEKTQKWTRELIDYTLSLDGTFYLPYQSFAKKKQLKKAYPQFDQFIALKKQYDPQITFVNNLYAKYA